VALRLLYAFAFQFIRAAVWQCGRGFLVAIVDSPWIVCPRRNPSASVRLICVPYAGAGVAAFTPWTTRLPRVEVAIVRLPGRESRYQEPFCESIQDAAHATAAAMTAFDDGLPFALFGHSMGALVAFEVARRLQAAGSPPSLLVASGWRAPSAASSLPPIAHLSIDQFAVAVQQRYGGIPEAVLAERELMSLFMPTLRADVRLVEHYQYQQQEPLTCPIAAFGGIQDVHAAEAGLRGWAAETTQDFELRLFGGGHFFIQESRDQVLQALAGRLASIHAASMSAATS
jgi:medium-chain acyl-[acyl-carrier-protein] hydrolase